MRHSIIQFGEHRAFLKPGKRYFECPTNPPLESRLNAFLDKNRGYSPDALATLTDAAAMQFNGTILELDRLPVALDRPGYLY